MAEQQLKDTTAVCATCPVSAEKKVQGTTYHSRSKNLDHDSPMSTKIVTIELIDIV